MAELALSTSDRISDDKLCPVYSFIISLPRFRLLIILTVGNYYMQTIPVMSFWPMFAWSKCRESNSNEIRTSFVWIIRAVPNDGCFSCISSDPVQFERFHRVWAYLIWIISAKQFRKFKPLYHGVCMISHSEGVVFRSWKDFDSSSSNSKTLLWVFNALEFIVCTKQIGHSIATYVRHLSPRKISLLLFNLFLIVNLSMIPTFFISLPKRKWV